MGRFASLFEGDEPAETIWGLLIVWPFLFFCGPPLLVAQWTESTRHFAFWTCFGWLSLFWASWQVHRALVKKFGSRPTGALGVWLGVTLAYIPAGVGLVMTCLEQEHWSATFIVLGIGLGLVLGSYWSQKQGSR